jgi:hypothetical protein
MLKPMDHLLNIARSGTPDNSVQFRRQAYGDDGIRSFLRDVLALANATVEGPRYIVVGVNFDDRGRKTAHPVDADDFAGKPSYQSLANEYIEPPVRIRYKPVSFEGKRVGVFEIGDCQDQPYMMRVDFDERLRRGDAYRRINNAAIKSAGDIEVGFPGEIIHKQCSIATCDLSEMPSALASRKLEEMLQIRQRSQNTGSTTMVARLNHARLYGTESPYVDRSPEDMVAELKQIRGKFRNQDRHFLFNERAQELQLVIYNQGEEQINDASVSLLLPNHNDFYVADRLPKRLVNDRFVDRTPDEIANYPAVSLKDDAIHVSFAVGDIPAGEPVNAFAIPLRLCVGDNLRGRRFGLRYAVQGQNLRAPARGQLKLKFD